MEKTSAVMKIDSFSAKDGTLLLSVDDYSIKTLLKEMVEYCENKHNGYVKIQIGPPSKKRSLSANNLYWARCTEFGKFAGSSKDEVSYGVKVRAMEMGLWRGKQIPFSKTGEMMPDSSATADTEEFSTLLKVLDLIVAEYGYSWRDE